MKLKPCPFCGLTSGRERIDLWQGATTYGGCCANISGDSKEEVIDKWNQRVVRVLES